MPLGPLDTWPFRTSPCSTRRASRTASSPYLGTEEDRGDGHLMGRAVGGDLINMTMIPPLIMVASALVEESIAVTLEGRRFHDEAGPYDDRVEALGRQADGLAWYVFDERVARSKAQLIDEMPFDPKTAPTLEALAAELQCDPRDLVDTVNVWNETVTSESDRDPLHGRVVFPDQRRADPWASLRSRRGYRGDVHATGGAAVAGAPALPSSTMRIAVIDE